MEAGFTGQNVPWELLMALISEKFNIMPWDLDEMPADRILRLWQVLNRYYEYQAKRKI
jgi:hypothetical protein